MYIAVLGHECNLTPASCSLTAHREAVLVYSSWEGCLKRLQDARVKGGFAWCVVVFWG